MSRETIDLVFSFDTTGSMYPCLTQVRRYIQQTVEDLFRLIPNIRIGIITHGDYYDGKDCIAILDLTSSKSRIINFVKTAPSTDGGDTEECYELVLNTARGMTWKSKRNKALVLIGDDIPHKVGYSYRGRRNELDWKNEAELLAEAGITVFPVQALGRYHAESFYSGLARTAATHVLELPQFSDITHLIQAICHQRAGRLVTFEESLHKHHKPSWATLANLDRLAGRRVRERPRTSTLTTDFGSRTTAYRKTHMVSPDTYMGLKALTDSGKKLIGIHPSRFQILDIGGADATINQFTRDNGLEFRKGRGFYEFTKAETIQSYKEVILEDPETGRLFTGNKARILAGLPIGEHGKFKPNPTKYTVFVQSTSANRRLKADTRFLYEIPDHEEATKPREKVVGFIGATKEDIARFWDTPKTTRKPKEKPVKFKKTARKCTLCGETGHNRRTCPNVRRCSVCGEPGHNKRTCPFVLTTA